MMKGAPDHNQDQGACTREQGIVEDISGKKEDDEEDNSDSEEVALPSVTKKDSEEKITQKLL